MTLYDSVRRADHSTLGDAQDRFDRDADAFTAGAQYALDRLLANLESLAMSNDLIESVAARMLRNVHRGQLS